MQNYFVVNRNIYLLIAVFLWIIGWGFLFFEANSIFQLIPHDNFFSTLSDWIVSLFSLFFGPICALYSMWKIEVNGKQITITIYYRFIIKKSFNIENDIKTITFSQKKGKNQKIIIIFKNNIVVKVDSATFNFRKLKNYLVSQKLIPDTPSIDKN